MTGGADVARAAATAVRGVDGGGGVGASVGAAASTAGAGVNGNAAGAGAAAAAGTAAGARLGNDSVRRIGCRPVFNLTRACFGGPAGFRQSTVTGARCS